MNTMNETLEYKSRNVVDIFPDIFCVRNVVFSIKVFPVTPKSEKYKGLHTKQQKNIIKRFLLLVSKISESYININNNEESIK